MKLFVQPSFGLMFNVFDIALSTRLCRLSFKSIENNTYGNTYINNELNTLANKNHLLLEPAIPIRGGWKNVKLQFQAAYSGYLNNPKLYFFEEYHFSIGLDIALGERYI